MENLYERLKEETRKAKEKSASPKRKPRKISPQKKAKIFLGKLSKKLLKIAKQKPRLEFHEVCILRLGHQSYSYEQLNEFQKSVFDGCKDLGLPVTIEETFSLPPGDREFEGYSIYLKW